MGDVAHHIREPLRHAFARASDSHAPYELFLKAILQERPELQGEMAYFPGQGRMAYTVIIGDEVFKSPASRFSETPAEAAASLRALEGAGLPVPRVTCVGKRYPFYAMTRLPGVILDSAVSALAPAQKEALAEDLTDFLFGMARAMRRMAAGRLEYGMHNDLHGGNILVDPATGRLTGVIDFGPVYYFPEQELKEYFSKQMFAGDLGGRVGQVIAQRGVSLDTEAARGRDKRRAAGNGAAP